MVREHWSSPLAGVECGSRALGRRNWRRGTLDGIAWSATLRWQRAIAIPWPAGRLRGERRRPPAGARLRRRWGLLGCTHGCTPAGVTGYGGAGGPDVGCLPGRLVLKLVFKVQPGSAAARRERGCWHQAPAQDAHAPRWAALQVPDTELRLPGTRNSRRLGDLLGMGAPSPKDQAHLAAKPASPPLRRRVGGSDEHFAFCARPLLACRDP